MKPKRKKRKKKSFYLFFLMWSLFVIFPAIVRADGLSNEAFVKEMVKSNWLYLENQVPALRKEPFAIVAQDSTSLVGRLVATLFRDVAFSEKMRPVFVRETGKAKPSEWTIFTWVTGFRLMFSPANSGLFHKKKWQRSGFLENRFEIVDGTGKVLWSGTVKSTRRDILTSREFRDAQETSPVFLRGTIEQKKSPLWKVVQLTVLFGISAGIVGLFYSIRTS